MTLWQFRAALDGYAKSHETQKDKAPTDEEFYKAVDASKGV